MDFNDIDWKKDPPEIFRQLEKWRRGKILNNISLLDEVLDDLNKRDIFNHGKFKSIRSKVGTQEEWAAQVDVSQGTIGNYERNVTYPNKPIRVRITSAVEHFKRREMSKLQQFQNFESDVDPVSAKKALDGSILNAALTDFKFDEEEQKIVAVPFDKDMVKSEIEQIEKDRSDLLDALSDQASSIAVSLQKGANANVARMVLSLTEYSSETKIERSNPRKLYRWGNTISRAAASDEIAFGISDWDKIALDGFIDDHNELMRLYYREALANAQAVEAELVPDDADLPKGDEFLKIADIIDEAKDTDGKKIFASDIPTLLRDIAREINEQQEAEMLTFEDARKKALRRRRVEAVKNGSLVVGRFLFFTSFIVVVDPVVALGTAGSIASIMGLIEAVSPGSVRSHYEKLRQSLPFLPRFPAKK